MCRKVGKLEGNIWKLFRREHFLIICYSKYKIFRNKIYYKNSIFKYYLLIYVLFCQLYLYPTLCLYHYCIISPPYCFTTPLLYVNYLCVQSVIYYLLVTSISINFVTAIFNDFNHFICFNLSLFGYIIFD